ncbi:MAG: class II aldolase/adducin family protein [Terriglobia bacterium]
MKHFLRQQNSGLGRREFLGTCARAVTGAVFAGPMLGPRKAWAQAAPVSGGPASPGLIEDLVAANRILADQEVVDGFGHVSVRHDKNPNRYLISRSLAPALVTAEDLREFDLDSRPVSPRAGEDLYSEVFIHGEIYKARPDVQAVVHNHSPAVIPFSIGAVPIRPVFHMSSFIGQGVPNFDIRKEMGENTDMLVLNPERGRALARVLGDHPAALMRGHGCVVVADALPLAVFRSVYLQVNASIQMQAMALNSNVTYLTREEADLVQKLLWDRKRYLRAWDMWKQKAMGR